MTLKPIFVVPIHMAHTLLKSNWLGFHNLSLGSCVFDVCGVAGIRLRAGLVLAAQVLLCYAMMVSYPKF